MATYDELRKQAEELMRQAEEVRNAERATNIAKIRAMMTECGITMEDLAGRATRRAGAGASKAKVVKFRGPNGEEWSGGLGRKPEWVRKILAEGGDLEQYRLA